MARDQAWLECRVVRRYRDRLRGGRYELLDEGAQVVGDSDEDVFNGLSISLSFFDEPRK